MACCRAAIPARSGRITRTDVLIVLGAVLVSILVYANAVRGEFVYDDANRSSATS